MINQIRINTIQLIQFKGRPNNYHKIDETVSRSAQPQKEDLIWLKQNGITDIFNFRTMYESGLEFDEKTEAEKIGIKYHSIPSYTRKPEEKNIDIFLKEIDNIKKQGGKAHIHCKAGADRTGMYAFIYKTKNNIGELASNLQEWIEFGHNKRLFPNLQDWTINFIKTKLHKTL